VHAIALMASIGGRAPLLASGHPRWMLSLMLGRATRNACVMALTQRQKSFAKIPRSLWRIRQSGLPAPLRSEAIRAELHLNLFQLRSLPNPTRLMGYSVSYFEARQLRYLFDSVFAEASYNFSADTDQPFILDCGSNIGMSILFFKKLFGEARIVGFEPDPATYRMLLANIEQNGLRDVVVHNCALSDNEGTIQFYRDTAEEGSLTMSVDKDRCGGEPIVVPARRLSTFITDPVDLLKMDIEGAEYTVLPELAASGKLSRVKKIHLEYHHHITRGVDQLSSMLRLLEEQGFGYQIQSRPARWAVQDMFQDIAIYCYRKTVN
jgi:FkbM family methyltransferase